VPCEEGDRRSSPFFAGVIARAATVARTLREVFYGATGYEFERQAARLRGDLDNLFLFMLVGDTIGVPILPPYYALRLVPYVLEDLPMWQRRVLRERHPLDHEEFDLHGV
jgi:hypothetical protein